MSNLKITNNGLIRKPDAEKLLANQIGMLYTLSGQVLDKATLKAQAVLLQKEIETYFPNLSAADFETAMNKGVRGDYGQYFGLNIITYQNWIKAFLEHQRNNQKSLPPTDWAKRANEE